MCENLRTMNKPTLCWTCQRAVGANMCDWAKYFEPVKGWVAKPVKIGTGRYNDKVINSYLVITCPLYIKDVKKKKKEVKYDDNCL